MDASCFHLPPAAERTSAPRGQTPVLHTPCTRDHLAAISAITSAGDPIVHEQERAICGTDVVGFLRQPLRLFPGRSLALWDGASIHRNPDVTAFLAAGAATRLHPGHVPAYAPDLNPDEGIWRQLKDVELRNRRCQTLEELRWDLRLAVRRLRRKRHVIRGCFAQCGFAV